MEPQRSESARPESKPEQKKRPSRFQIVKLEERIAPDKGGTPHQSIHCSYR
jgi:hypothetical protein